MSRFPFLTQPKVINQTTAISSYVNFRPRGRGRGENVTTSLAVEYFFNKGPYRFTPAPTLWYKIRHAGPHVKQRDIQNKTTRASQAWLSFVFNVPLPNLRPCWLILYHVTPPAHSKGVFTGFHFQPLGGEMHCGRKVPCHANEYNDPGPVSARTQTALNPEFNALIFIHHVFLSQFIEERDTEHKRKWKHNAAPLAGSPYN